MVLFIEQTRQNYQLSISNTNIIFLDIKNRIYDIKSLLGDCFFIKTPENTTCSVFKPYEPPDYPGLWGAPKILE